MTKPKLGKLFVFEGGDGIGKSHIAGVLSAHLKGLGLPTMQLSFPGKREGSLANLVYEIHHRPEHFGIVQMTPLGLQALHIAAHLDEIISVILPALESGKWILLDRFWWSTWVYGVLAGANRECLELLIAAEKAAWADVHPSAVFVIERDRALREEHNHETFQRLTALYADVRNREGTSQPTHILDNNDLDKSKAELLRIAGEIVQAAQQGH